MDSIKKFFDELQFGKLEKPVKAHLQNVYAATAVALLACAIGGYLHLFTDFMIGGIFSLLASAIVHIGILIALVAMSPSSENRSTRFQLMIAFCLLSGLNMGPLLDRAIEVDPSFPTAFLATALIFVCFSLSALLADDRKYLALGGILFSGLSWLTMFLFLNIFIGSQFFFQIYPYIALLLLMLVFVLCDTQLIVEKCRNGDDDYIMHCLMLFIDFVDIFRKLVIIMTDKKSKMKRR